MPRCDSTHTEQYTSLTRRVTTLCDQYLPSMRDPLGDYSDHQRNDADACVVLVHAAIETYLEGIAKSLAAIAVKRVESERYDWLAAHFLFNAGGRRSEIKETVNLLDIAKGFKGLVERTVNGNHGIKEKDVTKLFEPFGRIVGLFKTDTLASLDAFGVKRGGVAHLDYKAGVRSVIEPFETKDDIKKLLEDLGEFDMRLLELVPDFNP